MSNKRKMKFVRIEEIVKRGKPDIYDGVEISRDETSIEAVVCGPDIDDEIHTRTFLLDEFKVKEQRKEKVEHYFRLSFLKSENKVNDAEFDLLFAKEKNQYARAKIQEFFGVDL